MEAGVRLGAFVGMFLLMACLELWRPRRAQDPQRLTRWSTNIGLAFLSTVLIRVSVGGIVYSGALWGVENRIGLFNFFALDPIVHGLLTFLFLDVLIYAQHVASHKIPLLWRMHQVHHTDQFLDTSSGVRFHPFEILFSLAIKVVAVILLGADPFTVILFEVILNTCAVFNHANVAFPVKLDRVLRKVIVTPDMHRVHHSIYSDETDSNFSFSLSIWDRIFGTYQDQPRDGHVNMQIGLNYAQTPESVRFAQLLTLPLKSVHR